MNLSVRDFLRSAVGALGWRFSSPLLQAVVPPERRTTSLFIGGGRIDVDFETNGFDLPGRVVLDWVSRAAQAVSTYYGLFPVPRMRVRVQSSESQTGVFHGTTWGYHPPLTRISVGRHTSQKQLEEDWMMTHELVHTAFPNVPDQHHWIEEGIATYVEPIARVQTGDLRPEQIWADMVRGMPNGQPKAGDSGLDHTHTWGRTYWGGALFCLLADVNIRRASRDKVGLQHALRAIQRAGGTIDADWAIVKALHCGDAATHTHILTSMYSEMKDKPVTVDLPALWTQLGVTQTEGKDVSFNNHAPWASTRLAITRNILHLP